MDIQDKKRKPTMRLTQEDGYVRVSTPGGNYDFDTMEEAIASLSVSEAEALLDEQGT